ncbi:MAG: hypothetical protein J6C81_04145 [Muribaculaceae bacterium]|nr:hypothetical protein [Muribaculaceae bacterium]
MAVPLSVLTEELKRKIERLASKYAEGVAERESLRAQVDMLKTDIERMRKELDKARLDIQFLTVSHKLAQSPDALVDTRKVVAALIRDIDKCIAQLKE